MLKDGVRSPGARVTDSCCIWVLGIKSVSAPSHWAFSNPHVKASFIFILEFSSLLFFLRAHTIQFVVVSVHILCVVHLYRAHVNRVAFWETGMWEVSCDFTFLFYILHCIRSFGWVLKFYLCLLFLKVNFIFNYGPMYMNVLTRRSQRLRIPCSWS